jgi:colanic acid/amylovoran biosynthesis protein
MPGSCDATISSCFHGLVSALSQGVPSLSTGWGHKYSRLFDDYGFGEGVVSVLDSEGILRENINMLLELALSVSLRSKLTGHSAELKRLSEEMWALVFKEIHKKLVNAQLQ